MRGTKGQIECIGAISPTAMHDGIRIQLDEDISGTTKYHHHAHGIGGNRQNVSPHIPIEAGVQTMHVQPPRMATHD